MHSEAKTTRRTDGGGHAGPRGSIEEDPRRDPKLLSAIARVAPGMELRQGIDDIIRSHEGALVVVGNPDELSFLYSGGIRLDQPFRAQLLFELAKMDGAIIVNESVTRLAYANVQLMPDPTIPSAETGTRHRTAERVAKQTGALVLSISQQRETVTLFVGSRRYALDPIATVLAKANQALAALDTYRQRLEQVLTRLTALEFQSAVMLDDVLVVVQRAEMTSRMVEEVERDCIELGSEGRLLRMQLDELIGRVPEEKAAVVHDYHASDDPSDAAAALQRLAGLPHGGLLELEALADLLGYPRGVNPLDHVVSPRGYRALGHIPRLPSGVIRRVVFGLDGLDAIMRASQRELESVEGVGSVRAREIREGLRRLQEHNLVDRYLNM
jgi:diadenylate cyclase